MQSGRPTISRAQQRKREKLAKAMAEKKLDPTTYVNQTPFRYAERNFKSRYPPPDFSQVIYPPTTFDQRCPDQLEPVRLVYDLRELCSHFGVTDPDWQRRSRQAYILKALPGLVIIPNPFTPEAQRNLIQQCLAEYPHDPNTSNLHTHYDIPSTGLWPIFVQEQNGTIPMNDPSYYVQRRKKTTAEGHDNSDKETTTNSNNNDDRYQKKANDRVDVTKQMAEKAAQKRTLAIPLKACDDNFKPNMNIPKPDPEPADTVPLVPASELIRRLRWITLGYHYHWPTKTYHLDRRYPVPTTVANLVKSVVSSIEDIGDSAQTWKNTYKGKDYRAEAGVVNYYQLKDSLMGHVDRSELNTDAPLISISLGNSCIFLLGGLDRQTEPVAIHLQSGDIIAMTKSCRRSFHGVPRILENTLPAYLDSEGEFDDAPNWSLFGKYMSTSRLNINIRQVHKSSSDNDHGNEM